MKRRTYFIFLFGSARTGSVPSRFVFVFLGIAISSQVGDFIESYIKRNLGVKDTGKIIPGHGGLLDRFDGLIFTRFFVKVIDFFLTT